MRHNELTALRWWAFIWSGPMYVVWGISAGSNKRIYTIADKYWIIRYNRRGILGYPASIK